MPSADYFSAGLLGIVEGLTEFLPVSSTGHLILADALLGIEGPASKLFDIVIQLGAILAVCWVYRERFTRAAAGLTSDPTAQRFVANILVAFLPAAVVGVLAHRLIKEVLFSPWVVAVSPGVSRAGATIMGGLMLGVDRPAATQFSFFLAVPTMFGAAVYDLYKNRAIVSVDDATMIAIGFVVAFICALFVVRTLVGFVSRHGFGVFAWYRIALGGVALTLLVLLR